MVSESQFVLWIFLIALTIFIGMAFFSIYTINIINVNNRQYENFQLDSTELSSIDGLLNLNAQTEELIKTYIDNDDQSIKADKIHLGTNKTLTNNGISSVQGFAKHGDKIIPPWGNTDNWEIFTTPSINFGREETNSESDNALLKFECFATNTNDKSGWTITARYKYRNKIGDGVWKGDSKTSYLLIPK